MSEKTLNRIRIPAILVLGVLGLLWGAAFPAIEVIVDRFPPLTGAGIRYGVAGTIVLGYATWAHERVFPKTASTALGVLVVGVCMFGVYQGALFVGTQHVSGAVAAVVVSLSPVIAALLAVPLLGESRGLIDLLGFVLGIAGVTIVAGPGSDGSTAALGIGLILAGTALFAAGSVTVQIVEGRLALEALLGWGMLIGASLLFMTALVSGESLPAASTISPTVIASLVYVTLIAGALGYLLYFRLVRAVGATETTLVAYLEPVFATLVSIALLDGAIAAETVVGFLAVATGFALVSRAAVASAVGHRYDRLRRRVRHQLQRF